MHDRIISYIQDATSPIQAPELKRVLDNELRTKVSASTVRKYLREKLGMSYVRLGIVSPAFNTLELRLLRQIAAKEYIE